MKALATKRARIGGVDGHDLERHASRLASDHAVGARHSKHKLTTLRLDQVPGYLSKLRPYFSSIENASPIAPWFLDNDYLIQRAARQISQDLKASSHARLPSLVGGETRVHSIAGALILVSELQLDESAIDRFVEAYQNESPLRMAELWALPAMLRLCVLEELVGALVRLAPDIEAPRAVSGETPIDLDDCERFVRCLQSIRLIDSIRWKAFYVRSSVVERVLSDDPVDRYRVMDFESADMYRHAVAEIAWGSGVEETEVAKHAVELARDSNAVEERTRHIGYYLIDDGREKLERAFVYTPDHRERMRRWVLRFPTLVYLGGVAATTAAFWAVPLAYLSGLDASWPAWAIGSLLSLVLASALGITVVQWALTRFLPPRVIPKLDLSEGIPKEFESVVAIPTLMGSGKDVRELIRQVEVHHLSNTDPNLRFAILADYHDAKNQHMPGDDELLRQAQTGIALLNEKYGDEDGGPFHVLVRDRQWNPKQGCWMGWERKRGKLEEFNALLTGDSDASSSYTTHFRDLVALRGARFVITLDTDTSLPPGSAARLIGALGHPLNRAQFDAAGRVTAGYTVLQPRTEISPQSANRSLFTRIYAGDTSIDIYSRAVSDVYQDLLGEGSFVGKGIYDPVSFQKSLADRVPVNAILSHDLFEGIHGRVGLCSDIVLYEDYPPPLPRLCATHAPMDSRRLAVASMAAQIRPIRVRQAHPQSSPANRPLENLRQHAPQHGGALATSVSCGRLDDSARQHRALDPTWPDRSCRTHRRRAVYQLGGHPTACTSDAFAFRGSASTAGEPSSLVPVHRLPPSRGSRYRRCDWTHARTHAANTSPHARLEHGRSNRQCRKRPKSACARVDRDDRGTTPHVRAVSLDSTVPSRCPMGCSPTARPLACFA
ncbi:hypothetical protein N9L45_00035 [Planctomycetota bacterium]|nr:hypothetical protein [Planctomycetota bacterium]